MLKLRVVHLGRAASEEGRGLARLLFLQPFSRRLKETGQKVKTSLFSHLRRAERSSR